MIRQFELLERVKAYDPQADEDALNRAYVFAMKAHGSQTRASGDPYFSHPIEVAGILTSLKLDTASIITALLHDTVEDTDTTIEDIERLFGKDVARLVDGVTKLSRLELQSEQSRHAENFRKLVLALSEDIRVLLVKLADRLHNMQTLHYVKSADKRRRIALETMEIYAPLAERIGMQHFKDDLEDLAFKELHPEARESIIKRLEFLQERGGALEQRVIDELQEGLRAEGVDAEVTGRMKTPYSIWRKMQRKDVGFEQLSDIMAFRIVVDSLSECYHALGVLHSRYPVVPGRFKDYLSTPKPNGYRSLHTGLIGPERQRIEVQIRTREMHEVAEYGVAAHWIYKQPATPMMDGRQYRWVRELLDILEHASNPEEFLEHTKMEMFQDQVFVFTPKGDLIALPRGSTPVDFAYAVHSEVGDTCVGSRVNGRMVPLKTRLRNGDQVEIVTSKAQTPSPDWEKFVITGKAKARIRRFVRMREREQYSELGRQMLQKAFRQEGYEFTEKALANVLKKFKCEAVDDLYVLVGRGNATAREVVHAVFPGSREDGKERKVVPIGRARGKSGKRENAVPIKGLIPGMAVHFAHCCHPLPGERIVGIVTTGKGVTVHTIDCDTLDNFQDTPERWIDLAWDVDETGDQYTGRLHLVVANEPGSLGSLSTVIGRNKANISNLRITHRSGDFFELLVDLEVADVKHLTNVMAALRATPVITSVERARG
ncbi:RelA/SpoT family protein [Ferruginivarius sediminum]|uniref:GTP pyrophosphokinase rsh n=1 Tax=Ferruginivarius sediminum TaxID=2661937 RepID=A0A369TG05_9PROT|nr:bifunctional (p)ppGpp synthetase/guanosine-3',5'-bis(diphosphate) 3'-pyrophosphohydrolase [Ferruginivarius sediminum]RDD63742.1 bifunctional (p)ppGpp synthetase/guanosine-3',5'-bis(diphosphate) 3'-pyrophosphohydrolase [Ferruginivarius sediminum]